MNAPSPAPDGRHTRPLSPHLQIYRFTPTMAASILHRITGVALYAGSLLVAWWLTAAAISPAYFDFTTAIMSSIPGRLVLFGYTFALMLHMLGGIRHFFWDGGVRMDKRSATRLAQATFVAAVVLTLALWAAAYWMRG